MKEVPGLIQAPFSVDQIKSINRYQSDNRTSHLACEKCGSKFYANEQGLLCGNCFNTSVYVPKFTSNWAWSKFKYSRKEE
jgi:protein-arginine kinase activator protein McsA